MEPGENQIENRFLESSFLDRGSNKKQKTKFLRFDLQFIEFLRKVKNKMNLFCSLTFILLLAIS